MFFNNANYNRNDGIVIFIRDSLVTDIKHYLLNNSRVTITNIALQKCNRRVNIICLYRPPNTDKALFLEDLESYLISCNKDSQINVFLGDININIMDKDEGVVNLYLSILSLFGFVSCINSPTRVTQESSSCLDHIFIRNKLNNEEYKINSFVIHSEVTDHYPVMLNIKLKQNTQTSIKKTNNTIVRMSDEKFCDLIKTVDWNSVLSQTDVNLATNEFYKIISNIREKASFTKRYIERKIKKPWITNGLLMCIESRDRMKKKLLTNYNIADNQIYKQYRNNLKKIIQKSKHDFYKNKIENAGHNLKRVYKIINDATDNQSHKKKVFHL